MLDPTKDKLIAATVMSSPDEKLSCDPEPRSGERYIAWGVSPRIRAKIKEKAAERRSGSAFQATP